jgi:Glycosyl hydrolase family 63 C-terminal domain
MTAEERRLEEAHTRQAHWRRWGPYLSERQWGTVREDYSPYGAAWDYFPHDHARSRAYRWGEDGIAGISDNHQRLCFAIALWNGEDPILKERLFGLTGTEGNHAEDVKEYYFYLDNTPSHAYMKYLYKYPHLAFPYTQLVQENQRRGYHDPEFELMDTGIFEDDRYFDVVIEYAKNSAEDMLIQISVTNRGSEERSLHLLPTLWFRNTWSWDTTGKKPSLKEYSSTDQTHLIEANHPTLGTRWLYCESPDKLLFTENETNYERLFGTKNTSPFVKDGIDRYVIHKEESAVNSEQVGTKAAGYYLLTIGAGQEKVVRLRLSDSADLSEPFGDAFTSILKTRQFEADEFYRRIDPNPLSDDARNVQRQAFAGMLWSKQFYHFVIENWLKGDPNQPPPNRQYERNAEWIHLFNDDILSMPDKWEFPWFAAWDLAFHTIPLAMIDPAFAKRQLDRLTREWYMHPNGQIPAYEWQFGDVNPPVEAWATWRIYQIEQQLYGRADTDFLERVFQKLLLNFTWWVNREDEEGNNIFEGGFLGLDNIGVFDRNAELSSGAKLEQSDGTSWMAMYSLTMLKIALELAKDKPPYEDIASKFFEHFLYITDAMNQVGDNHLPLWEEEDGFYYDVVHLPNQPGSHIKVRSIVGLLPLCAVEVFDSKVTEHLPDFKRRVDWFKEHRPHLTQSIVSMEAKGTGKLLSIVNVERLKKVLQKLLDETEFLSDYGIRSVSKIHEAYPCVLNIGGQEFRLQYEPAESRSGTFGGNSNWRGPIWVQMNYLLIEALQKFHHYFGEEFKVECPTGSGQWMHLGEVSTELSRRVTNIFLRNEAGERAVFGGNARFQTDPHWRDFVLFHEYFHGDNGAGLGANHQTGWTGLIATLIATL